MISAGEWIPFPEVTDEYPREGEQLPNHREDTMFWVKGTTGDYPKMGWYDWQHNLVVFSPGIRKLHTQQVTHWLKLNPPKDV